MQTRALLILGLALILGGVTVVLVNRYLDQQVSGGKQSQGMETRPVVVATSDIRSGTALNIAMLKTVEWPTTSMPEGSFSQVSSVISDKPPIALTEIKKGEPVLKHRLSSHGSRGGLPTKIPEDMRAVTIPVTEVRGVAGFVSPGTFVDVLHTTNLGRVDERPVTRMILQNVHVLGIDQSSADDDRAPRVVNAVTLLVTPHDGQRVTLALATGNVSLLLRNEFDASLVDSELVSYQNLLTSEKKSTVVTKRERRKVEVIRGLEITNQDVKEGDPAKADETKPEGENVSSPAVVQ